MGGGSFSLAGNQAGLRVVLEGSSASPNARVVQTAPSFEWAWLRPDGNACRGGALLQPADWVNQTDTIDAVMSRLETTDAVRVARDQAVNDADGVITPSDTVPPNQCRHYYVVMRAPGSAGATVDLMVESLDRSGQPLRPRGVGQAPVRAMPQTTEEQLNIGPDACGATTRALPAWRMSDDPTHPHYNLYIARPLVVVYEPLSAARLVQLRQDREVLYTGARIRVALPVLTEGPLRRFGASVASGRLRPVAQTTVKALGADTYPGPNPSPLHGSMTVGPIDPLNGQIRMGAIDLALPTRGMPLSIDRHYTGQSHFMGPFGLGWDFSYNQRLLWLDPALVENDDQYVMTYRRANDPTNVIGEAQDA